MVSDDYNSDVTSRPIRYQRPVLGSLWITNVYRYVSKIGRRNQS